MAKNITVKAKITAGWHPGLRAEIIEGHEYIMNEHEWSGELFERPSPDWLAPWEQPPEPKRQKGGK